MQYQPTRQAQDRVKRRSWSMELTMKSIEQDHRLLDSVMGALADTIDLYLSGPPSFAGF
ncbi:hypothetical protein HS125_05500 [bacterium]|nr:hypothetical protein [bacterium]